MERGLTPELKKYKEEFDFLHKKIGELEWKRATFWSDRITSHQSEIAEIEEQLQNYLENMNILIGKIEAEAQKNHKKALDENLQKFQKKHIK